MLVTECTDFADKVNHYINDNYVCQHLPSVSKQLIYTI